jgi:Transposase IS116/IS110/IS902 family
VPGIGKILSLVLLYEIHDISRFPSVQDFVSYCRLVKCAKESAGKRYGTTGTKIGNAYLKWAFSEAAVLFLRDNPPGQKYLARLENKHGKGKALTILAHQLARAVYYMLKRATAFKMDQFIHGSRRGAGEPDASRDTKGMSLGRALCNPECLASSNAHECVGRISLSPAPLMGHPLLLRGLRRWSQRFNVCCPSPEPEPNWRRRPLQPPLCVRRYEGTDMFLGRRARSIALQSSSRRRLNLHKCLVQSHAHCTCSGK